MINETFPLVYATSIDIFFKMKSNKQFKRKHHLGHCSSVTSITVLMIACMA